MSTVEKTAMRGRIAGGSTMIPVYNPSTEELIGEVPDSDQGDGGPCGGPGSRDVRIGRLA